MAQAEEDGTVTNFSDLSTLCRRMKLPDSICTGLELAVLNILSISSGSMKENDVAKEQPQVKTPTPIQCFVWKATLENAPKDVIGVSYTGSGKTLAFSIPLIAHVVKSLLIKSDQLHTGIVKPRGIALAPTRELAVQTNQVVQQLIALIPVLPDDMNCICAVGGSDLESYQRTFLEKKPTIVIATPGRLLSLCGKIPASTLARRQQQHTDSEAPDRVCDLSNVVMLIFDEADRLLDLGFEEDIRMIHSLVVNSRNTMSATGSADEVDGNLQRRILMGMFSATWNEHTSSIASAMMSNPIKIEIGGSGLHAARSVTQVIEVVKGKGAPRFRILCKLLVAYTDQNPEEDVLDYDSATDTSCENEEEKLPKSKILVFVLYKKEAQSIYKSLESKGFSVGAIHGNMTQRARQSIMDQFRNEEIQILVATDVAARGLDVTGVSHVINFSLGMSIENYVHRIGRCGRAGSSGVAHTLLIEEDFHFAPQLIKILEESNQKVPPELRNIASRKVNDQPISEDLEIMLEQRQQNREKQLARQKLQKSRSGQEGRRKKKK
eukprot:m.188373 g.188373  ORF g.188373 m.188373 type:complete len:550 (+) comp15616_c0_seq6:56-1705(+)